MKGKVGLQYVQGRSVEGKVGLQYVQERSVQGMTVSSMYRRGVWRVSQWAVCTGEECGWYDSGQYAQERSVEGMIVGSMHRRGV